MRAPAHALLTNLSAGFRLATLRAVAPDAFRCDASQIALLALTTLVLAAVAALVTQASDAVPLRDAAVDVLVLMFSGAALGLLFRRPELRLRLPVVLLSVAPAGYLAAVTIHLAWVTLTGGMTVGAPWLAASAFYVAWVLLVHYRGIEAATALEARATVPLYAVYLAIGFTVSTLVP